MILIAGLTMILYCVLIEPLSKLKYCQLVLRTSVKCMEVGRRVGKGSKKVCGRGK